MPFSPDNQALAATILPREKYTEDVGGDYREWLYFPGDQKVFGSPVSSLMFSKTVGEGGISYYIATS